LPRAYWSFSAGARTRALRRTVEEITPESEFVVVANPDVQWGPRSIDLLLEAAERWPRAGSLGPLIRDPDGSVYPSARHLPSLIRGGMHAVVGPFWKSNPWTAEYRQERTEPSERPVGWLSGSCLLLRRSAFDEVSGFDERYFMYMEDVDLGDRLGRAGWQNVYVPSAEILHDKGHAAGLVGNEDGIIRRLAVGRARREREQGRCAGRCDSRFRRTHTQP